MKILDHTYQVLYSELAQRTFDDQFVSDFSVDGRFVTMESNGRRYWYFDTAKEGGGKARRYVGPVDDEAITHRVDSFKNMKADYRSRRKIVSTLVREAYLPRPDPITGNIVAGLNEAGLFRLRGVLIGTVAFQCYPAVLGSRFPVSMMQTADVDFAQFKSISDAVDDSIPPILDILREVEPTFREIPHQADNRYTARFSTRAGYKVEFLTPNTGAEEYMGQPATMPALGGASAQPLRFLDFLIHEPVRAVMLHGPGIPVLVPSPERFAVHKLIVASRRRAEGEGADKSAKDRQQAKALMEALIALRQEDALADVYMEAWDRGPAWREAITESLNSFSDADRVSLEAGLAKGIGKLGGVLSDYES